MNLEGVYLLGEQMMRGSMRVDPVHDVNPLLLLRAEIQPETPLAFSEFMEGKPRDIIGTGHAALFLVSERFTAVLRQGHFNGWQAFAVRIAMSAGGLLPGYARLAVTGRCGSLNPLMSQPAILRARAENGRAVAGRRGLIFDVDTWDGSDIFVPAGSGYVFVTEIVRDAITRARLTNVSLDRITEIEIVAG